MELSTTVLLIRLLLASEHRGPHATGVAWVKRDGDMQVAKAALPARTFVQTGTFMDWLFGVDRQVTYLMGHTRWPSHGSVQNPENNHPLSLPLGAGHHLSLSHNGTLVAVQRHFDRLGLPRTTQVDSELLARIAQRHTGLDGIHLEGFLNTLTPLEGSMSVALVASCRAQEIILLKGNMPLEVRLHRRKRLVLYASEARILDKALNDESGWEELPMAPGEALVFNTTALHLPHRCRFTFRGLDEKSTWHRYTGK